MQEETMTQSVTRRKFLEMIGKAAGSAMLMQTMTGLGVMAESTYEGPLKLEGYSNGKKILILGAGLAGMTAALELSKQGYECEILEYNARAGGRVWTVRAGTRHEELGGATQISDFDEGQYLNPGPWRIPYSHRALLDYCRRLGVALEVFINHNRNALIHNTNANDGKPVHRNPATVDFVGYTSELLAKATNQGALDETLTAEDREKLLEAMRSWGALDREYRYTGSSRRGYDEYMGAGHHPGIPSQPQSLQDLLGSEAWRAFGGEWSYESLTMFQPVGGMDRIARAFERETNHMIRYESKVTQIRQGDDGVTVTYENRKDGSTHTAQGDYCICTIPLSVLSQIPADFSPDFQEAVQGVPYHSSVKIGLQFKRRFWEEDHRIYGGSTTTNQDIGQIGYPSGGMFGQKGVLLAAYNFGADALSYTADTPQERIRRAFEAGAKIHPQYHEEFETGFAVAWHRVPWTLGCYAQYPGTSRADYYDRLLQPDGRVYLAGEHLSYLTGWMEGAILSSIDTIKAVHARAMTAPEG
jgi:monoamine oxidase